MTPADRARLAAELAAELAAPPSLVAALADGSFRGTVPAGEVADWLDRAGLAAAELAAAAVPLAASFARPAISGFRVGAVLWGAAGSGGPVGGLHLGANLEFPGLPLAATVHAEQAAVAVAWAAGERSLAGLAVSAAPCGHCRQFLMEASGGPDLAVLVSGRDAARLPGAFGPADLGVTTSLLEPQRHALRLAGEGDDPLVRAALEAASESYAPYSRCVAGVAARTRSGATLTGRYAENAAYNTSLGALPGALVAWAMSGAEADPLERCVLVHAGGAVDHVRPTAALLAAVAGIELEAHLAVAGSEDAQASGQS